MKLLVVTPTLGESPWLAETVASVAAVAVAGVEVTQVLVAPEAKRASLATRFPKITVVAEPGGNLGMYAAINAGLAAAGGWEAFTYLNDDDLLRPDFATVARAAAAGGRPLVAYGGVRLIGADGRRLGAIPISPAPALNRALYAQRLEPVYQHGTVATRAVFDAIGGFDATLRFCGDSEFLARAWVRGIPFERATRREVAAFRLRPGQATKNRPAMIAERARVDEKHGLLAPLPVAELRRARWRFRCANLAIYAERIARHGFVTFDELLERGG
jgi:glycosyltransferase involved in cell wall biosynthesis